MASEPAIAALLATAASFEAYKTTTATASITATATATSSPPPSEPGETLKEWSSIIGIVTAIVGNVLIALALNVQRYAHTRLHRERARVRKKARAALKRQGGQGGPYGAIGSSNGDGRGSGDADDVESDAATAHGENDPLAASYQSGATNDSSDAEGDEDKVASTYLKSPYWWLGQILITLGEMGNFLAYGFAPASIVSPLGVVALISNCIIAPVMFHEKFRQRDFWGVVIAVAGVVTVVLSARQEETKLEPHDVWAAITSLPFEIYMAITITLIIILMVASGKYGRQTLLIDLGLVGLFGGYTALATKGVSSMLSSTLWRAFTTPVTYVLVVILLGTAIMQIRYVNKALQRFDSTQVIPIQFVMFTLCVIIGSAVLYRDFEKTTPKQAGQFVGGCLLTFFGVFLITSGRHSGQEEEEEDVLSETEGVEETIGLSRQDGSAVGTPVQVPNSPESKSRRSSRLSRVSFAETIRAQHQGEDADVPPIRFPEAASSQGLVGEQESSPLLGSSWDPSSIREAAMRTKSADSVAVETPPVTLVHPVATFRDAQGAPVLPSDRPVTPRPNTLSRSISHHRSGTFISPSPLSSTVTQVVKDAFLRSDDNRQSQQSSLRRIRSSIRASLFFSEDGENSDNAAARYASVPGSEDNIARTLTQPGDGRDQLAPPDDDAARRRSRSVSDTLGDFFRPRRKKPKDGPYAGDLEAGEGAGEDREAEGEDR